LEWALLEVRSLTPGPAGLALLEEALVRARALGDPAVIAMVLLELGGRLRFEQPGVVYARAPALLEAANTLFRAAGEKGGYAATLNNLGALARDQGDYARATTLLEEALALAREKGNKEEIADVSHNLGETALMQGDTARAEALEQAALALWREVGSDYG